MTDREIGNASAVYLISSCNQTERHEPEWGGGGEPAA